MQRLLLLALAIPCLVVGAFALPTPLPIGLVLIVIGLGLLLMGSPGLRRRFLSYRRRNAAFDNKLRGVENYLPAGVRRVIAGGGRRRRDRADQL